MSSARPIQDINLAELQSNIGKLFSEMTGLPYAATVIEIDFEPSGKDHAFSDEAELRLRLTAPGRLYRSYSEEPEQSTDNSS